MLFLNFKEVKLSHGLRLKKQIELNLKEGEKIKVSPVGDVIGLDGRAFKIDGESLLKNILMADLHIPLDINHGFDEIILIGKIYETSQALPLSSRVFPNIEKFNEAGGLESLKSKLILIKGSRGNGLERLISNLQK